MARQLEDLLLAIDDLGDGIEARAQWLEDTAAAVEEAGLGEPGTQGAQNLRAALGSMVVFSQGAQTHEDLAVLVAALDMFIGRALTILYDALAQEYAALVAEAGDDEAVRAMAALWRELARATEAGEEPGPAIREQVVALRRALKRG